MQPPAARLALAFVLCPLLFRCQSTQSHQFNSQFLHPLFPTIMRFAGSRAFAGDWWHENWKVAQVSDSVLMMCLNVKQFNVRMRGIHVPGAARATAQARSSRAVRRDQSHAHLSRESARQSHPRDGLAGLAGAGSPSHEPLTASTPYRF
jgi:hypothetical protein